jgi:hypothetical protein
MKETIMERKIINNDYAGSITFGDGEDIQELITALIDFKREKKKQGWSNLKIHRGIRDDEYPGGVFVFGDRRENDDEMENRRKSMEMYEESSTEELLAKLDKARKHGLSHVVGNIKDALALREHIPNKLERKAIRRIQAKTGIKDLEELREKHGSEIAKMVQGS